MELQWCVGVDRESRSLVDGLCFTLKGIGPETSPTTSIDMQNKLLERGMRRSC